MEIEKASLKLTKNKNVFKQNYFLIRKIVWMALLIVRDRFKLWGWNEENGNVLDTRTMKKQLKYQYGT